MKNIFLWAILVVVLNVSNAYAKQHQKVSHCDYDDQTYVETCYGEDNRLLNGWAVEGEEHQHYTKNRRKLRKLNKEQKRFTDNVLAREEVKKEIDEMMKPYVLSKFRNGKKEGLSREVNAYGFGMKRIEYSKGQRNGNYETYYPNFGRQAVASYRDGVLNGTATFYNSRGKKIGRARYKKGILIEGFCRDENNHKIAMPTDGKTIVTEVTPCPDNVINRD